MSATPVSEEQMETLRYPIGRFSPPDQYDKAWKFKAIDNIRYLPRNIELAIENMDEVFLQTPYRPGGWTVHQLIHHIADSHINAYTRFKLALTEDKPVIKPYEQALWATLPDVASNPVNVSITLLHALHRRWVSLLEGMSDEEYNRKLIHPEQRNEISLWEMLAQYDWHSRHHLAHILHAKEQFLKSKMIHR